jgi:hypothetical protein
MAGALLKPRTLPIVRYFSPRPRPYNLWACGAAEGAKTPAGGGEPTDPARGIVAGANSSMDIQDGGGGGMHGVACGGGAVSRDR